MYYEIFIIIYKTYIIIFLENITHTQRHGPRMDIAALFIRNNSFPSVGN